MGLNAESVDGGASYEKLEMGNRGRLRRLRDWSLGLDLGRHCRVDRDPLDFLLQKIGRSTRCRRFAQAPGRRALQFIRRSACRTALDLDVEFDPHLESVRITEGISIVAAVEGR